MIRKRKMIENCIRLSVLCLGMGLIFARPAFPGGIDSLRSLLDQENHDTVRVTILNDLCWSLKRSDPEQALKYGEEGMQLVEKLSHPQNGEHSNSLMSKMAEMYNSVAVVYAMIGDYPKSKEHFIETLKIHQRADNKGAMATTYSNIGLVHTNQGDYTAAIEHYFKSLKIRLPLHEADTSDISNKRGLAMVYNNLGIVYWNQAQHEEALDYYNKSLKLNIEMNSKVGMSKAYNNMGIIYSEQGNLKKALESQLKGLELREEIDDKIGMAFSYGNIGQIYQVIGDGASEDTAASYYYPLALDYQFKSLEIREDLGHKNGLILSYKNIGWIYQRQGRYTDALTFNQKSLEIANEIGDKEGVRFAYSGLTAVYEILEDYKSALKYQKLFTQIKDTLFNEDKSKEIGKLEAKHEFETMEQARKRAEEAQLAVAIEAESRRNNLQYSGILMFLVILAAGLMAMGRFAIPVRLAEGLIFFTFLLFFEFCLVLLDPYIEQYSSGEPVIKLGFNAILAAVIFPLHSLFEEVLKGRLSG